MSYLHKFSLFTTIEVKYNSENDSKEVFIHKPLYMKRILQVSHCYSTEWLDEAIVKDIINNYPQYLRD